MPAKKLKEFLDSHNIKYIVIAHSRAYTAPEIAQTSHIPGKELAKTVMVKIDGKMTMTVLPSTYHVDLSLLQRVTQAKQLEIASEEEFKKLFPDCEVGAMPPFGNLYGIDVFVSEALAQDEKIAFNAGSHVELIQMAYRDFERLVNPKVTKFSA